ncbi:ATP-binding protein [Olsenella sp. An293]|uniref:ATP-binding protein n=1 Tax=Olsenella sp. An293 TaxID=1965626 RepID=UPI000B558CE9|nr:ATP-binding protein [Olsenella sp. An293]OUO31557.1 AAA family ATPase [Olsenella sp. An293]
MIDREMHSKLHELAGKYPILSVTGPRQGGKTTLVRSAFADYEYLSMEDPDVRSEFEDDPRLFLSRHASHIIFDEAQRTPELFSYLQGIVDETRQPGQFVITGSQNFLLMKSIGQSLAGRVALFTLLPLSHHELSEAGQEPEGLFDWLYQGGYPRLVADGIDPLDFFPDYVSTYLERDVRAELGVRNLSAFQTFLKLCALRVGQLLNVSSLASDCGISPNTAKEWLSILEASHLVFLLCPHCASPTKRLVKSPKLYFCDTGLAAHLMGISSSEELSGSPLKGPLFECAVISELKKRGYARKRDPQLTFWRDGRKREIDVLVERGARVVRAVECKSSTTYQSRYFDVLNKIAQDEFSLDVRQQAVVYGGEAEARTPRGDMVPYTRIGTLLGLDG